MILPRRLWPGVLDGSVTLAFRRWKRPSVRAGGTLHTGAGVLAIDAVDRIAPEDITPEDARAAGEESPAAVLHRMRAKTEGELYRIAFHHAGADPRIALRSDTAVDGEVLRALAAIDARSRRGPWTRDVLELIAARPATLAAELAEELGRERLPFKADVRRLKALGLTESLEVGYRLSPRGEAVLAALRAAQPR